MRLSKLLKQGYERGISMPSERARKTNERISLESRIEQAHHLQNFDIFKAFKSSICNNISSIAGAMHADFFRYYLGQYSDQYSDQYSQNQQFAFVSSRGAEIRNSEISYFVHVLYDMGIPFISGPYNKYSDTVCKGQLDKLKMSSDDKAMQCNVIPQLECNGPPQVTLSGPISSQIKKAGSKASIRRRAKLSKACLAYMLAILIGSIAPKKIIRGEKMVFPQDRQQKRGSIEIRDIEIRGDVALEPPEAIESTLVKSQCFGAA